MKKRIQGKKDGSAGDLAVIIIGLLAMLTLLAYSIAQQKDINNNNDMDLIVREYLLKLETNGNMDDSQVNAFKQSLRDTLLDARDSNGNKLFDIDSSSLTIDVTTGEYGEEVGIEIHGKIALYTSRFGGFFGAREKSNEDYKPFSYCWKSTSKS